MTTAPNTPQDVPSESELDAGSLDAIRSILTEEVKPEPRTMPAPDTSVAGAVASKLPRAVAGLRRKADVLPPLEAPVPDPEAEAYAAEVLAPKPPKRKFSLRRNKAAAVPKTKTAAPKAAREMPDSDGIVDRLRSYRPTGLHIALAAFGLFVIMRPWLVLGLFFIFLFIMVGVFLITGYDGFWQHVMKVSRWYANRRPSRAAAIHARLDRFAVKWDSILDRFPEGAVDALYLPDFGDLASADRRHDEAMERRLSGMQNHSA